MGRLIDGEWTTQWYTPDAKGRFVRQESKFRNQVTADGGSGFGAAADRYHLYVSYACPWASRVLIMRKLKKLEDVIGLSVVDPLMTDDGWHFSDGPGAIPDTINGAKFMREVYQAADPKVTTRVTVPVLWDKEKKTIVNNESRELIRMLETEFDAFGDPSVNFCPPDLREQIDATIDENYEPINNGVYRCGFATKQEAYDEAVEQLFAKLDKWDEVLGGQRYLCGDRITEADWCLFVTLIRFDLVYYVHFKTNKKHIYEYPNLFNYIKELYQVPGVSETVNFDHIKQHYYRSHPSVNPHGIVPAGGFVDFTAPHDRDRF